MNKFDKIFIVLKQGNNMRKINANVNEIIRSIENLTSTTDTNILGKIIAYRGDIIQLDHLFDPIREYYKDRIEWTIRDTIYAKDTKFSKRCLLSVAKALESIISNEDFPEYKMIHVKRILDTILYVGNGSYGYFTKNSYLTQEYDHENQKCVYVFHLGENTRPIEFNYHNHLELHHD